MKNLIAYLQYMPNKHHSRFNIKKFELCDATSGCVLHMSYTPERTIRTEYGQAHGIVMERIRKCHLLNKGYHLFTDNFYTKPLLDRILDTDDTLLTGTVRSHSKGLPAIPAKLNVGQMVQFRDGNSLVVAFREKESQRKPVLMLTPVKAAGMVQVRTAVGVMKQKPKSIAAYNKYMGGVDIRDRKLNHVLAERPSKRNWKKILFNFYQFAECLRAYGRSRRVRQNVWQPTIVRQRDFHPRSYIIERDGYRLRRNSRQLLKTAEDE